MTRISKGKQAIVPFVKVPKRVSSEPVAASSFDGVSAAHLESSGQPAVVDEMQNRFSALLNPLVDSSPSIAPAPSALSKLIQQTLGPSAGHLSALEVASALGHASWADAIAALPDGHDAGGVRAPNFLLAAKLAHFMDNAFVGATLDEISAAFTQSVPGAKETFGVIDGARVQALQKAYAFVPQWEVRPEGSSIAGRDWDWLASSPEQNIHGERLGRALKELSQISFDMDLTRELGNRYSKEKPFSKANVVMVQHALGQGYGLVAALAKGGLDAQNSEYVLIPYQQVPAVKLTLGETFGLAVSAANTGDIDGMYQVIGEAIDRAYKKHCTNGLPVLVVDDGGYGSKWIAEHYPNDQSAFHLVEQTTRGLTEVSTLNVKFPVVNVAGSYGKRLETDQIGEAIYTSVGRVLELMGRTANGKDVLVVGAGKVGLSTARAAQRHGAKTVALYDPLLTDAQRRALTAEGFRVIATKEEALRDPFLIIPCSGKRSIEVRDFLAAASNDPERPVFFAEGSSKRVDVDHAGLQSLATDELGRVRKFLVAKVNEQETFSYWLEDGRMVTALADDLPVNFQGINSVPPERIDGTIALMLVAARQALKASGRGLVEVDEFEQFDLQARKAGFHVDAPPAPAELTVKIGAHTYSANEALWLSAASSTGTPPAALTAIFRAMSADGLGPVAHACLSPLHDIPSGIVDDILERAPERGPFGYLQQVALLLANENLSASLQDRLMAFLEETYTERLEKHARDVFAPMKPVVEALPRPLSLWQMAKLGVLKRDKVTVLLGAMVLANTRDTASLKTELLADPELLAMPLPENIHALRNASWSAAELDVLCRHHLPRTGSAAHARYGYDLWEAFAQHPNSTDEIRRFAASQMEQFAEQANGAQLGSAHWPSSSAFEVPMPEYGQVEADGRG